MRYFICKKQKISIYFILKIYCFSFLFSLSVVWISSWGGFLMPRFRRGGSSNTHDQANLNFLFMKNFCPVFRNYCSPDDISVVSTQKLPVVHNIATDDPNLALMIDEQCEQEQELTEFTVNAINDDH